MDMSKLPRLSNTPTPPESGGENAPDPEPRDEYGPIMSSVAEAWISVGIGVLLLLWNPSIIRYLLAAARGERFSPLADESVVYVGHYVFWSDLAITLFAVALVVEGIILGFFVKPWPVLFALILTAAATLLNFIYLISTTQYGIATISALAVIFGVYMALHQWKLYRVLRTGRSAPMT